MSKIIDAIYNGVHNAMDTAFEESKHKRDKNGRFTSGENSGESSSASSGKAKEKDIEYVVSSMSKEGKKIYNSNKSKIYEIAGGDQLPSYIKKDDIAAAKSVLSDLGKINQGKISPETGFKNALAKVDGKSPTVYTSLHNMREVYRGAVRNIKKKSKNDN